MAQEVILDDKKWRDFLRSAIAKSQDFGKYLMAAANIFGFKDIIDHFDREQGPEGPWPARSESTNRAYDIMGGSYSSSNKLLQLTGRLRGSFLPGSSYIKQMNRLSVKLYSDPTLEYAGIHDEGSGNIPQREFMWLSDHAKEMILTMLLDQLAGDNLSPGGTA